VNRFLLFLTEMLLNLNTTNYGPVAANISEERLPSLVRNQGKTAVYIATHSAFVFYGDKLAIKTCFIFPLHLTSASVLPGEVAKPGNCVFLLKCCILFTKKH